MKTTPPDDVDALFDLTPLPPPSAAAADADVMAAAEAALAAELASAIEAGGVADDAPDSRADLRVEVSWPARLRLPDGRVVPLQVRNVSEGGVGMMVGEPVPAATAVDFEMDVPPLAAGGPSVLVKGTLATTYTVVHGAEILCGGTWQSPPDGLALVTAWIRRLWR